MKKKSVALGVCLILFASVGTAAAIPYNVFDDHMYKIVVLPETSWDSARLDIQTRLGSGYYLAEIESHAEQKFIESLISSQSLEGEFWLGGRQPQNEIGPVGSWSWENSAKTFWDNGDTGAYENWHVGEANDFYGAGSEQHLAMWSFYDWQWNDEGNVINMTGYIAEAPLNDLDRGANLAPVPAPEPATLLLFGSGLIGLTAFGRKRFEKK